MPGVEVVQQGTALRPRAGFSFDRTSPPGVCSTRYHHSRPPFAKGPSWNRLTMYRARQLHLVAYCEIHAAAVAALEYCGAAGFATYEALSESSRLLSVPAQINA